MALQAHVASLEAGLEEAKSREAKLQSDVKVWQEALPARDTEIQNLQVTPAHVTLSSLLHIANGDALLYHAVGAQT